MGTDYEYSMMVGQTNWVVGQPAFFNDRRRPSRAAFYVEAELNLVPKLSIRIGIGYIHLGQNSSRLGCVVEHDLMLPAEFS